MSDRRRVAEGTVTVLRNLSQARRPFGYLGDYGREVSGRAEFVFLGQVEDQPGFNERKRKSFLRDRLDGRIEVDVLPLDFATASQPRGFPTDRLGWAC